MSHSCIQIYLHIIFSTKDRRPLIYHEIEHRLHGYLAGIANEHKVPILEINGAKDHLHMLLKFSPNVQLATLMKELKCYSSGWMKKAGYNDFRWQEGYGAFSCSVNHVPKVKQYIHNQKEHHKVYTFDDELERLNKHWGVKWYCDDRDNSEQ